MESSFNTNLLPALGNFFIQQVTHFFFYFLLGSSQAAEVLDACSEIFCSRSLLGAGPRSKVLPPRWFKVKGPSSALANLRLSLSMGNEKGHMRQLRKGKVELILTWLMIDIEIQRKIVWKYIISEISWLDRKYPGDLSKGKSATKLIGKMIVMHLGRNCGLKRLISSWCDDDVVMWRWGLPEISVKIGVHKTGI